MQQPHYDAIAAAVRDTVMDTKDRIALAIMLAAHTGQFNVNFNRDRFLHKCGVQVNMLA